MSIENDPKKKDNSVLSSNWDHSKNWKKMRQWVANNVDTDPQGIFRQIYDTLLPEIKSIPQLVLLVADYQYKAAFVADQEINLTACLTEIMANVEFE